MKKLIMVLMAVLFLGATTGVVFAQGTTPKPASTSKSSKGGKKKSHSKKGGKSSKSTGASSAPASAK